MSKPVPEGVAAVANFACRRCGACCRWEGEVHIAPDEVADLAAAVGMTEAEFLARLTRLTADRRGLSLTERPDGACILYVDQPPGCRVYDVRPRQCRSFPHAWNFPGWQELCPGID